mgnify:CR=1 FL=1
MGETAYLQNRSSTPFTQLKGPRAIRYRYPGVKNQEKYDLIFAGHDEKFGTSDDINNWASGTERRGFSIEDDRISGGALVQ